MSRTIIHINGLSIESNFRFKLRNYGHLNTNNAHEINNYIVNFKSLLPKEFFQKYLTQERMQSSLSGIELSILENSNSPEVFAISEGESDKPGYAQSAIFFIFEALRLFNYSKIHIGRQFMYEDYLSSKEPAVMTIEPASKAYLFSYDHLPFSNASRMRFGLFLNVFMDVWKQFVVQDNLRIALRHFGRSVDSIGVQPIEDRILHLVIALESLLSPADDRELKYRIALHAAYLLEQSHLGKERIYNLILDAYGIRSKLAHGSLERLKDKDFKRTGKSVESCLNLLTNLVRDVLMRCAILYTDENLRWCKNHFNIESKKNAHPKEIIQLSLQKELLGEKQELYKISNFTRGFEYEW